MGKDGEWEMGRGGRSMDKFSFIAVQRAFIEVKFKVICLRTEC